MQPTRDGSHGFGEIVGESEALRRCLAAVDQVAPTGANVLVLGETGTGKELIARAVHERSPRREGPLVTLNCAALPPTLIESELFGHERGAFTGAGRTKMGCFELASGGTLFLDEVGELPLELQSKLLRALQEGEIQRLGSEHERRVDVRIVAATNRDLAARVERQEFRGDLYYRLNVFPVALPPLRERREDIAVLARHFVAELAPRLGRSAAEIPPASLERLREHDWPGNIRELRNVIERSLITTTGPLLEIELAAGAPREGSPSPDRRALPLHAVESEHLRRVLEASAWWLAGPEGAAERLGLRPSTLRSRLRKLGIRRP